MRILLVEDSQDSLLLMKMQLELIGHTVIPAEDAYAALELAQQDSPDVLISDVRLPEMDGCSLLLELRKLPRLESIPAIAVTGLGTPDDIRVIKDAGFDASAEAFRSQ